MDAGVDMQEHAVIQTQGSCSKRKSWEILTVEIVCQIERAQLVDVESETCHMFSAVQLELSA